MLQTRMILPRVASSPPSSSQSPSGGWLKSNVRSTGRASDAPGCGVGSGNEADNNEGEEGEDGEDMEKEEEEEDDKDDADAAGTVRRSRSYA